MNIFLRIAVIFLALAFVVPGGIRSSYAEDTSVLSGKVIETMDSGGYTYVQIEKNGTKTWVAVPSTKVVKGQNISFSPGMEMQNFESKTLKRKFDRIVFSGGVVGQTGKGGEVKSPGSKGSVVSATEDKGGQGHRRQCIHGRGDIQKQQKARKEKSSCQGQGGKGLCRCHEEKLDTPSGWKW